VYIRLAALKFRVARPILTEGTGVSTAGPTLSPSHRARASAPLDAATIDERTDPGRADAVVREVVCA